MITPETGLARQQVVAAARYIHRRGLTHGRTGNLSIRLGERILITPTGASLGSVQADQLSVIRVDGEHLGGPPASKEAFLHVAMLRARPSATAVVHTHSSYSAAVSCLAGLDPDNALPPLTAYFAMRVGQLPLLAYHAPGDLALGPLAEDAAQRHPALLLRNHGPIVAGQDLDSALDVVEELEETAKLFLLLHGRPVQPLTTEQADALAPTR
ncbi:aldolase [Mycolicibacterium litorale]|nr:aldolase [Mycolicibacterium litorale]